jgi:hypothetical protein
MMRSVQLWDLAAFSTALSTVIGDSFASASNNMSIACLGPWGPSIALTDWAPSIRHLCERLEVHLCQVLVASPRGAVHGQNCPWRLARAPDGVGVSQTRCWVGVGVIECGRFPEA